MKFLGHAACGDWDAAVTAATAELGLVSLDETTLRELVQSLAPGDSREAEDIAVDLAPFAEAGHITAERCNDALSLYTWLALRAKGDQTAAVDVARAFLNWPECNLQRLDEFLCQIIGRSDGTGQSAAQDLYRWLLMGHFTSHDLALALSASQTAAEQRDHGQEGGTGLGTEGVQSMKFLGHAACGDWDAAVTAATAELGLVSLDETTLRKLVRSLAPWDSRGAEGIAVDLAPFAEAGHITAEGCNDALYMCTWLALRAKGDQTAAVGAARAFLDWPECNLQELDDFLCQIIDRSDVAGQSAAKDLYWQVLTGRFTSEQFVAALLSRRTAAEQSDHGQEGPSEHGRFDPDEDRLRKTALEILQKANASLQKRNRSRYLKAKGEGGDVSPISFAVYGGGTRNPVLIFDEVALPDGAVATYMGSLKVSEKAGSIGTKVGRFFKAKGTDKFSGGTIAGVMTVTPTGNHVDLPELERLLRKNGITDKKLIEGR
ncbi:hypothetical protein AB0D66_30915 [Streptomyces sp. NPDC048270]|uniref:hypothetical protein n=1 Tax=Streptomyces sp. NPDC048270 TaxID=3154615 RepID=UPI0033E01B02